MLCTAPTLRTAAIGCRMQPTLLTPHSYHTTAPSSLRPQTQASDSSTTPRRRAVPIAKRHVSFNRPSLPHSSIRSVSTTSPPPSSQDPNPAHTTQHTLPGRLDWNTFFKLRRTRRYYQLGSSITTSLTGFVAGAQAITMSDMDALVSQIPLDPFITLGLITFTCGGIGWLMGPIVGTGIFNLQNRKVRKEMDEKEKEFYRRVKRYRVDPSASSMANPVPGESSISIVAWRGKHHSIEGFWRLGRS